MVYVTKIVSDVNCVSMNGKYSSQALHEDQKHIGEHVLNSEHGLMTVELNFN